MTRRIPDLLKPGNLVAGDDGAEDRLNGYSCGRTTQLLKGEFEEQFRVALLGLCDAGHAVEGQLGRAVLDHRQHVGVDVSGFGGDLDL